MKIAIIGCGWLGLPLAQELVQNGHNVLGTSRSQNYDSLKTENLSFINFDLNFNQLPFELATHFDVVIISIPPAFRKTDPTNYLNNLNQLIESVDADRLIYLSSTAVYPSDMAIAEEDTELPDSAYLQAEKICQRKDKTIILRLSGLFGPGRFIINSIIQKNLVHGGLNPVNLVHRDDVKQLIVHIIDSKITNGTFNICSSKHPLRKVLYNTLASRLNLPPIEFIEEQTVQKIISNNKLIDLLPMGYIYDDPLEFPLR